MITSVKHLLLDSFFYMIKKFKVVFLFVFINFLFLMLNETLGGWGNPMFLLVLAFVYVLWVAFFRLYFNKKPLIEVKSLGVSLVPSSKMLLLMFLFGLVLVFLPYIFIYAGVPIDFLEQYIDNTSILSAFLLVLFVLFSPNLLFRPYFAWIGAVIDRNKSIKFAFFQTKGNYFNFLLIMAVINFFLFLAHLAPYIWLENALNSFIFAYFNIVLIKTYELFFVGKE